MPDKNILSNGVVNLLLTCPTLHDAFRRPLPCEESRHYLYDIEIAEQALIHHWTTEDIVHVLRDIYQANRIEPFPAQGYFLVVCQEADLRRQSASATEAEDVQDFARETAADRLAEYWQIPVIRVVRHGDENSRWSVILADTREILLGTSKQLLDQEHVRAAVFDRTGVMIPRLSRKEDHVWDRLMEMFYAMATTIENPDSSRLVQAQEFLRNYLAQQPGGFVQDFDDEEWEALAHRNRPFRREGKIYIHARTWWNNCIRHLAPDITYIDALGLLRLIGAKSDRVTLNKIAHTDRNYWRLPPAYIEPILQEIRQRRDNEEAQEQHEIIFT